ncbi:hypothetical protein [Streptomyces sp. RKAG293]|uniref:hypothetical protein n=1 Tax=Streptomyces sp. RKAG293 TaxID=2893403 RepID=UPI00203497F7|nr:hypothetical protein [Streptomyces sp. RKAG293]MCM2416657.1 hypothetical protein [Streptomyces sp. RKAG293]
MFGEGDGGGVTAGIGGLRDGGRQPGVLLVQPGQRFLATAEPLEQRRSGSARRWASAASAAGMYWSKNCWTSYQAADPR